MVVFLVVLTVVVFIAVGSVVQWREAQKAQPAPKPVAQPPGVLSPAFVFQGLSTPGGIFLDSGHTWVGLDASGRARVGMDDFVQRVLGRIDGVELPEVGRQVRRGDKLFAIRQGGRTAVFAAPMDGVVRSVNDSLARHPKAIKADPYAEGWICALSPKNLASNLKQLSIAEEARAWLDTEVERFQRFFASRPVENMTLGHVLQDGGQLTDGVLELMDDESWRIFTSEFLRGPVVDRQS